MDQAPTDGRDILGWDGQGAKAVIWWHRSTRAWMLSEPGEGAHRCQWYPVLWQELPDDP